MKKPIYTLDFQLIVFRIRTNFQLVMKNYEVLKLEFKKMRDSLVIEQVWHKGLPHKLDEQIFEISRHLLNFLSVAEAVVDANRILINRNFTNHLFINRYKKERDIRLTYNPIVQFIEGLRNYSLYYEPLVGNIKPITSFPNDRIYHLQDIIDSKYLLKRNKLLRWDDWGKKGLPYLKKLGDDIEIEIIIDEYINLIKNFYQWLFDNLKDEAQ